MIEKHYLHIFKIEKKNSHDCLDSKQWKLELHKTVHFPQMTHGMLFFATDKKKN